MDRVGGQKIRKQAVRYCLFTPWLLQSLSQICHQTEGENRRYAVISAWCRTIDLDMHPQKKRENSQDLR